MNEKTPIDWPSHFNEVLKLRTEAFKEIIDLRRSAIEAKIDSLKAAIHDLEGRFGERIDERERLHDRAIEHINERLQQIYSFRDQITSERLTYITRDQLDVNIRSISDQLDILKRAVQLSSGKDSGVSRVWTGIAMALSAGAAIGSIITVLGVFAKAH